MSTHSWRRWLVAGGVVTAFALLTAVATTAKDHAKHEKSHGYYFISDDGDDDADARSQGYLGVSVQRLRSRLREAMDIPSDVSGLIITNVHDDTPADDAGLRNNDVILRVNSQPVGDEDEFTDMIRGFRPDTRVAVSIWRDGDTRDVSVTLGKRPRVSVRGWGSDNAPRVWSWNSDDDDGTWVRRAPRPPRTPRTPRAPMAPLPPTPPTPPTPPAGPRVHGFHGTPDFGDLDHPRDMGRFHMAQSGGRGRLGIEIQDMNEEIGEYFGSRDGEGVLVWKVREDSPADRAGMKAGDVIIEVEGHDIDDTSELREELARHDDGDAVAVTWLRHGDTMSASITLEEGDGPSIYWFSDEGGEGRAARRRARQGLDRGVESMEREMEALQRRMEELQEKMDRLKD